MVARCIAVVLLLCGTMIPQSAPPACPADRPIDDIIAEINKQQSNKRNRNTNPLPETVCVFGWCHDWGRTPPTVPEPAPTVTPPKHSNANTDVSTSAPAPCDQAMESALAAAHDVEVGDMSFKDKNYRGASMRYKAAVEEKPKDAAIHVRLGRAYEKLKKFDEAREQYESAEKLSGPPKWVEEAHSALTRLGPPSTAQK